MLLFDEPFSALDPLIRRDMQAEVRRLHAEVGKTMLFITHDLAEALTLGDRVAVLRDGALVQVGTPEQLVGSPADDYVRDFVRDVPRADVLSLRWIVRRTPDDPASATPAPAALPATMLIRDAVPRILRAHEPVPVVDDGRVIGVVGVDELLPVLAGHPDRIPA